MLVNSLSDLFGRAVGHTATTGTNTNRQITADDLEEEVEEEERLYLIGRCPIEEKGGTLFAFARGGNAIIQLAYLYFLSLYTS